MPKKGSAQKPTPKKLDISTTKAEKPTSVPKRGGSEIDEIFAERKKRISEKENEANEVAKMKSKSKKRKKSFDKGKTGTESVGGFEEKRKKSFDKGKFGTENVGGFEDEAFRPRKKTGDGFKVYTEDELGLGNANSGGTRLCPFDCDCCF